MAEKMLTFELSKDSDQLEIHGNKEGLEHLTAIFFKTFTLQESEGTLAPND